MGRQQRRYTVFTILFSCNPVVRQSVCLSVTPALWHTGITFLKSQVFASINYVGCDSLERRVMNSASLYFGIVIINII